MDRTTEMADRMVFTGPNAVARLKSSLSLMGMAAPDHQRFDDLENSAFLVDRNGDMLYNMFERQAHYMTVGASKMIASDQVCLLYKMAKVIKGGLHQAQ